VGVGSVLVLLNQLLQAEFKFVKHHRNNKHIYACQKVSNLIAVRFTDPFIIANKHLRLMM
jgi:hypothetical protein